MQSPSVGLWRSQVPGGAQVTAEQRLGTLTLLGRTFDVYAPRSRGKEPEVLGVVRREDATALATARQVAYGEALLVLGPLSSRSSEDVSATSGKDIPTSTEDDSGSDLLFFEAPLGGRFFASATPGEAPMATAGQEVTRGESLGLIEVMKTFHQIVYEGDEMPPRATICEIFVRDGDDVHRGQRLFSLQPAPRIE